MAAAVKDLSLVYNSTSSHIHDILAYKVLVSEAPLGYRIFDIRPLLAELRAYAVNDVEYKPAVFAALSEALCQVVDMMLFVLNHWQGVASESTLHGYELNGEGKGEAPRVFMHLTKKW